VPAGLSGKGSSAGSTGVERALARTRTSGVTWIYEAGKSYALSTSEIDSTLGAQCTFISVDNTYEMDIRVLLAPYPANTITTDLTQGVLQLLPFPGVGSEAYTEAAGVPIVGTGLGEMVVRFGSTWYLINILKALPDGSSDPGGTARSLKGIASAVGTAHPTLG
jgi:hypothetical protein